MGEAIANMWANLDVNQYLPGAIGWATNILLAVLILIVGYWIAGRVSKGVHALGQKYEQLDDTLFKFLGNIVRWIILAFVFIAVLNRFGVETTSIVALLGAAGLAVGLALQGAMSNLASGVMLLIFRPYKVGDFVDAAGKFGNVKEIDLFTRSRVRSSSERSVSREARSAISGSCRETSCRCCRVSPDSRCSSAFQASSFWRKYSRIFGFMNCSLSLGR